MLFNIVNFVICLTVEWCYQHNRKGRFPWQMAKSYHWNGGEVPDRGFLCHQWNSTHCPFFVQKVHWITHSQLMYPPPPISTDSSLCSVLHTNWICFYFPDIDMNSNHRNFGRKSNLSWRTSPNHLLSFLM